MKKTKLTLKCMECGKEFKRVVSGFSEPKCPKCKSTDVEVN